jgi:hypothetical protein
MRWAPHHDGAADRHDDDRGGRARSGLPEQDRRQALVVAPERIAAHAGTWGWLVDGLRDARTGRSTASASPAAAEPAARYARRSHEAARHRRARGDRRSRRRWRSRDHRGRRQGTAQIVAVDAKALRVLDATGHEISTSPVGGGILTLVAADLDGDKRSEVYAGWGQTREHLEAKARITAHRFEKGKLVEELVIAPETERPEVVAIVPMLDTHGLLVAYFDSKYMVTSMRMTKGAHGWTGEKIASLRTATSYERGDVDGDGAPDLVVGRVYGDDRGVDGDAFVLGPGDKRTPVPSTRGLRSLALADADGDGRLDIFMGDGWHQNYGQYARGLLTWSHVVNGAFTSELVEDTAGQYQLMRILPARIAGSLAIVTQGSHYVRVFVRRGSAWQGTTIAGVARDIAVGDLDGTPGDEILVIGETSESVDLDDAPKP